MRKLTRKDYEALLRPVSKKKKRRKRRHLKGGAKAKYVEAYQKRSAFVRSFPILSILANKNLRKAMRQVIIRELNKGELRGVAEIVRNFLEDRIPVSDQALRSLQKDRAYLHNFLAGDEKKKKNILEQKGGAFQALIPLAASALSPVIKSVFGTIGKVLGL